MGKVDSEEKHFAVTWWYWNRDADKHAHDRHGLKHQRRGQFCFSYPRKQSKPNPCSKARKIRLK